jgi:hypothetical protein
LEVRSTRAVAQPVERFPEADASEAEQGEVMQTAHRESADATIRSTARGTRSAAVAKQKISYAAQQGQVVEQSAPVPMMSDPGDPLATKPQTRFAPSSSRRLSSEPVIRTGQANNSRSASANRKASYNVPQGGYAAEGYEQAPAQQPSRGVAAQNAGFHHRRQAPMAAGCPGGCDGGAGMGGGPVGMGGAGMAGGAGMYDNAYMPNYAWPSYAAYPNYGAVTYPTQYSAAAWPYIGPFYPYPQVPLGWRKVSLEWDDGWWFLDFHDRHCHH